MAVREQDKRAFQLNRLREELLHFRKAKEKLRSFERLSLNKDFQEFKEVQKFNIDRCSQSINSYQDMLASSFTTAEQDREVLYRLRDEFCRKKTLEEMFSLIGPSHDSILKIDKTIDEIQSKIQELEEKNNVNAS